MECSVCGQIGHNRRYKNCIYNVIYSRLEIMDSFTHTYAYYSKAFEYLLIHYPNIFCVAESNLVWNGRFLENTEFIDTNCKYNYIVIKLSLNNVHANYLLIDKKSNCLSRYEPHGGFFSDKKLDKWLAGYALQLGLTYIPAEKYCPKFGIQFVSFDKRGMCQTAVLYSILRKLDPVNAKFKVGSMDSRLANLELRRVASIFLTHIYYKLPKELRTSYLLYNDLSVFAKQAIQGNLNKIF